MSIMIKINNLIDRFKEYVSNQWGSLSTRDKRIVAALIVFLIICTMYIGVIRPLSNWNERLKIAAQRGYDDLLFTQTNLSIAKELATHQRSSQGLDPATIISNSARNAGIVFSRMQPIKQGVTLWIDEVSYQRLLTWLLQLYFNDHFNIKQIRLEKIETEGMVKTFVRLGR